MQYYPFDSRQTLYRSHIGALASGESLQLRLLLHKDALCHDAFLRIISDQDNSLREIKMLPGEMLEDYRFYSCEISLSTGLYWYDFRYTSAHGEFFVVKEGSKGIVSQTEGNKFQQTVFDKDFCTPDWLKGGLIYQIFPDRFCNSGTPKNNPFSDRFICSDWRKTPEWRQNNGPCSLSNDYYCGDLKGIEQKLNYLKELGVNCIYLNPIFEAHSNHRYNTADYKKIDCLLGDEKSLVSLCKSAKKLGISIILDGVFSHTGDDSLYFNKYGRYQSNGAYNSEQSEYFSWFKFEQHPDKYSSWWGIDTLPETNEEDFSFKEFIAGQNGILRHYIRCGVKGWRLDVADELPDSFLCAIRSAIKQEDKDAYLLGEVWEDASNKNSYGSRRKFLQGHQLDSVMNYPFANAIVDFIKNSHAENLNELVLTILENYPKCSIDVLMNHIGTHDTARILTVLSDSFVASSNREWQSNQSLSFEDYRAAVERLKLAAVIQYTLPGIPSLYYGDEAGTQGYSDPFCRATYPWSNQDSELLDFYKQLGQARKQSEAFKEGEYIPILASGDFLAFQRKGSRDTTVVAVNRSCHAVMDIQLPEDFKTAKQVFGKQNQGKSLSLQPFEFSIITY